MFCPPYPYYSPLNIRATISKRGPTNPHSPQWLSAAGVVPSNTATYTSAQIQTALGANRGGFSVTLGCSSGALDEIWYHYDVRGSVQTGTFVATNPDGSTSTCPSTGIKYLPKSGSPVSSSPADGDRKSVV